MYVVLTPLLALASSGTRRCGGMDRVSLATVGLALLSGVHQGSALG